MRATDFSKTEQLYEIAALKSIANWFAPKYKAFMDKNEKARQAGEAEIRKFTNDHMFTFGKLMGRYRQDWDSVTMRVIYKYLRYTMKFSDNEITRVVNNVLEESGQQTMNIQAIQDRANNTKVGLNKYRSQITAEKIIAAAAIIQLEKHWENEAGVESEQPDDQPSTTASEPERVVDITPVITDDEPIKIGDEIIKPGDPRYSRFAAMINATRKPSVKEYTEFDGDLWELLETATSGATSSGSIACVANPMGSVVSRTPNLFGYVPYETPPKTKKRQNRRKSTS